jgi:A/G-specific adenine glycosylase
MTNLGRIHSALLTWYAEQARDLPWRRTRDPYAILVAEVMLQQTQVDRVIPKWRAWLERFPTLAALAHASRADAIRAWEGLGYNLRAVRLHAIACQCVAEFGGSLPDSVDGLLRLNGIGPYTAGAVACFAYEQPVAMVDTNIRRVLSRVFGVDPSEVERIAASVLPDDNAYAWNQALMDVGATLCRVGKPLCLVCPLLAECNGPKLWPRRRPVQGEFAGSNRFHRGRILARLRELAPSASLPIAEAGRPDLVEALIRDGLVETDDYGGVRLPEAASAHPTSQPSPAPATTSVG